nr:putative reverse transcriptase domain-containing protein [Tanacetum cinerariifolium]
MLNQLIAKRVAEALVAAAVTHALEFQFGISNVADGDIVKFASSNLLDGALTWWNVYVRSVTLEVAHTTLWNDFKDIFIRKYCPRNEELIILCPDMVPTTDRLLEQYIEGLPLSIMGKVTLSKPVDLHEAIKMAQGLMYQVVQEIGENSRDKRKWSGNHYNKSNTNNPEHHAVVVCYMKYIRIPYGNDVLIIQGERSGVSSKSRLEVISSIRTQKFIEKGCHIFLIHVTGNEVIETPERRIEDVPVVRDFSEVFPEDLPGLPPTRQVEFNIKLIPGAGPVARAPYCLAPTEMKELAEQLKELFDKVKNRYSLSRIDDLFDQLQGSSIYSKINLSTVKFLGHLIDSSGIHVDPAKIEAVKNCASPTTLSEIR